MPALTVPPEDETFFCCQHSRSIEEQLFASVKPNRVWFLLEYAYPWGRKAFEESTLSSPVKNYLSRLLDETPESKLLFIKSQESLISDQISFFVGIGSEVQPRLHKFVLDEYEDLIDVDLHAFLSNGHFPPASVYSNPVYLVCTNGKRDPCCAKFGLQVYDHLVEYQHLVEDQTGTVWQSTHVGGHRFAANVVCFPHGIYFGRVTTDEARLLMDRYQSGQVLLDRYRGRACYQPVVQAAEYFLRNRTAEPAISAFSHTRTETVGANRWNVQFASRSQAIEYHLSIITEPSDSPVYKSCTDEGSVEVAQYRLVDIETR